MAVVLIVEDEAQVRMLAEGILQEFGYETRSAATMTEAHAIIASDDKLDVLFVDIALMDNHDAGLELAQAAVKLRPDLPVIYTTGRGITDGMVAQFVQRNVFVPKPYRSQQLLTAISNVLN